jgi:hypothetical protein
MDDCGVSGVVSKIAEAAQSRNKSGSGYDTFTDTSDVHEFIKQIGEYFKTYKQMCNTEKS